VAQLLSDAFRGAEETFGAGKVERDGTILTTSYGRAVVAADVQGSSPEVLIFVGVGRNGDELRTCTLGLPPRNARVNTTAKRLGRSAGDQMAAFVEEDDWPIVLARLDGRFETVKT
jgi:hypothetical protein